MGFLFVATESQLSNKIHNISDLLLSTKYLVSPINRARSEGYNGDKGS